MFKNWDAYVAAAGEIVEEHVKGKTRFRIRPSILYMTRAEAEEVLFNLAAEHDYWALPRIPNRGLVYGPGWCGPFVRIVTPNESEPDGGYINYAGVSPVYRGDGSGGSTARLSTWRVNS